MFGIINYPEFILAALILNITPGVDTLYILTKSISHGKKAGLISAAGIMSGCVVHVVCAALGLSLILARSAFAFTVVKWAGACYLIYLGIKTFYEPGLSIENLRAEQGMSHSRMKLYRQGILTNVLNPKVALFFLSFLPQFIDPGYTSSPAAFLVLGCTFLVTGSVWCIVLTRSAAFFTRALRKNQATGKILSKISGIIFIGFGLDLFFVNSCHS